MQYTILHRYHHLQLVRRQHRLNLPSSPASSPASPSSSSLRLQPLPAFPAIFSPLPAPAPSPATRRARPILRNGAGQLTSNPSSFLQPCKRRKNGRDDKGSSQTYWVYQTSRRPSAVSRSRRRPAGAPHGS